jgi:hypothetical protein
MGEYNILWWGGGGFCHPLSMAFTCGKFSFSKIKKKDLFGSEMLNLPWYYIIVSWSLGLGC